MKGMLFINEGGGGGGEGRGWQNQLLTGKLQMLEQCQFSGVKDAVDHYLTQTQHKNEKDALTTRVKKLEKTVSEVTEEREKLMKDVEDRDEKYKMAMTRNKDERYSYEECIDKLNVQISQLINDNERLRDEKEDILTKYDNSLKKVDEMNRTIEMKNRRIEELGAKVKEERTRCEHCEHERKREAEGHAAAMSNIERMYKEEMGINVNLDNQLRTQDIHVQQLESKLRESKHTNELTVVSLQENVDSQRDENIQLQRLCKSLQSTNDSLNVRVSSLNDILRMQEPYTTTTTGGGIVNDANEQNTKLLQMWREKVYSLLVHMKMQDLDAASKHLPDCGDCDAETTGSSVL